MPVFLSLAGILLCVIGLFLVGFAIPIRDFSLGSTLIIAGATALVGGLIVFGLGATVRELRRVAKSLEKPNLEKPMPAGRPAAVAAPSRPATPGPARPTPKPAAVNTARSQRAEPRLEIPSADVLPAPVPPVPDPPLVNAPTAGELGAERPRPGLFASIRGRAAVEAAIEAGNPPAPPPPLDGDIEPPPPFERDPEPFPDAQPSRSPSLSALAARTAARLDLPRPVPDLPRVAPERAPPEPPEFERPVAELPNEKPPRNLFDTVWPTDAKPPAEQGSERREDPPPPAPAPRPQEILKSGVIDGMAYTLYTDGSIEAQLPQGTLRFGSIDDLRAHLERAG